MQPATQTGSSAHRGSVGVYTGDAWEPWTRTGRVGGQRAKHALQHNMQTLFPVFILHLMNSPAFKKVRIFSSVLTILFLLKRSRQKEKAAMVY